MIGRKMVSTGRAIGRKMTSRATSAGRKFAAQLGKKLMMSAASSAPAPAVAAAAPARATPGGVGSKRSSDVAATYERYRKASRGPTMNA